MIITFIGRFVLLENVSNMAKYMEGTVINLILACFTRLGYQVGNQYIPSNRDNTILLNGGNTFYSYITILCNI